MGDFFLGLFSNRFMPHKMCFLGDTAVLWLQVSSDWIIAFAYFLIPLLLLRFVRQRRDITFQWILLAFAVFILACGTSHILGAITVFNPIYRVEGLVKAITAIASVSTLLLLVPAIPRLVALPSPAILASANQRLGVEIEERRAAEAEVRKLNGELEERVAERTTDLERTLNDLRHEMKRREDLEKQLLQAQKMEAVGRLAGGVAHDFNNLLTVILGHNEMLGEQLQEQPDELESIAEIRHAAERASSLTQQLLAFSRQQVAMVRTVDLNHAVRHTEKMLRRLIGEDIELALDLKAESPFVTTDPSHIDQILLNLAVNARDAMPDGGALTIETATVELDADYAASHAGVTAGTHVMLAVADTGMGMSETTKARIFEPFFTTKEQGKGTGLGLSIVYGIVKQSGGEILVYSEIGQGTVFKILFPTSGAASEPALRATSHTPARPGGQTILLVEDDAQVRNLAKAMLQQKGYRVLACASASDAQALIAGNQADVDLLITDIVMPKMRGTELAARVEKMAPQIRVLYMSGYTEGGVVNRGLLRADMPFLPKPFTSAALCAKVEEALGARGQASG